MSQLLELIQNQHPFNLLTEEQCNRLFQHSSIKDYKKNQFIIHEDQDNPGIYFLVHGLAKNVMHRSNGKQLSLRFYYPGELIGIMVMLTSEDLRFSVEALEDSKVLAFNRNTFLEVMNQNQSFSKLMLDGISQLMKSLYQEIKYKDQDEDEQKNLFKRRVKEFMEAPVTIRPEQSLMDAVRLMEEESVGGLIVTDASNDLMGVLSFMDVFKAYKDGNFSCTVAQYMSTEPYVVTQTDFIFDGVSYLKNVPNGIIPVVNKQRTIGVLRQTSFLNMQDSVYFDLRHQISTATNFEQVKQLSPRYNKTFQQFVQTLLDEQMYAYDVTELISSYNDELHKQIIHLAEDAMVQAGYGTPPINYCFIVMGSEGRKEQAFSTDQDNGLILADYTHLSEEDQLQIDTYFKRFGEKINDMLDQCGFPYCTGNIMAREPKWRQSLSSWYETITHWINKKDAEEIRDFTIFIDFRPITGDFSLAYSLRDFLTERMQRSLNLHQLLMKDTLRFRVPVQPFGRIQGTGKQRELNLKKSAIMQIVNAVRIYAIKHGIDEVHTIKRLDKLKQNERFHPRDVENAKLALHRLLKLRLEINLEQLRNDVPLSNNYSLLQTSKQERKAVREALMIAKRLQQVLEISYNRNRVV
ncbi:hypothetical protein N781_06040 [Pontibacillus halophilus JSM 076056 = DSM 19796]|uniref:Cyclic nucleotide-binding protein n=1 Tax=Pontibacillus halophilus JSM 076056 = DSM 19796 TaxID=1385510 RepID=A0A0A5GCL5_9BACI|nr:DUF294 nucleotidyltransferase-like domain-containing protein [Pontibacillus halophilus]KGX90926.1 hypothetical protein N781_06040 [Pontibacillus halophilus JSM 076056 = DSM 19796]